MQDLKHYETLFTKDNDLDLNNLHTLISTNIYKTTDFMDLYFQNKTSESWVLEEGIIKTGTYNEDIGLGVRVVSADKTSLAYTNNLHKNSIIETINVANSIVQNSSKNIAPINFQPTKQIPFIYYDAINPIQSWSNDRKISFLKEMYMYTKLLDPRVDRIILSLSSSLSEVMVLSSDSDVAFDTRPIIRFSVQVTLKDKNKQEIAFAGIGSRDSYDYLLKHDNNQSSLAHSCIQEAVNSAITMLDADSAPAGQMPVVLANGWGGVLLHEAVGHGLEGDFNLKGSSRYSGKIGQQVANKNVTILDDGTIPNRIGSLNVDDEGNKTQSTVLIENGILKEYMQDKQTAMLTGVQPTGNGRRQGYNYLPMPRMTNTYMLPQNTSVGEIINSINYGIYCRTLGGGQVDITSGRFVFSVKEDYIIEKGLISRPVKGVLL